ncbi:MAG TPA: hypothetical protein VGM76_18520 [Lacipirellulaceae bacterium]|jgi:hypothetical protein
MSTTTLDSYSESAAEDIVPYRAIHTGAIVGAVLGALSVFVLIAAASSLEACLLITPIPVLGMFFALRSWGRIQREPDQYTGSKLALAGFALSLVFLVTGVTYGYYVYVSEVPDGYDRISFETFKPTELEERGGQLIPPEVQALAGKHVFIKGYIRPGSAPVRTGIDRFLLVRDNNQCCFGDLSKVKYFDQMAVQIVNSDRVEDTLQVLRMGGTLEIHPENLAHGAGYPIFMLKADYAVQ